MDADKLPYLLALKFVKGIGNRAAKNLIAYCGSPEAVFKDKKSNLQKIPGIGGDVANRILKFDDWERIEREINYIEKNEIQAIYFADKDYPHRLKHLDDAPFLFFYRGNLDLNKSRLVGIVGTRRNTHYGSEVCEKLVSELKKYCNGIISGLAYGIDFISHQKSVELNIPTVGVLAHGLDVLYPQRHAKLAVEMLQNGGLLSEFPSETKLLPAFFPDRNRIVAGLVDALVVVETAKKGGALITAEIAFSYDREVFAFPGRIEDPFSEGCNRLIANQKARLIQSADDIAFHMGWELKTSNNSKDFNIIKDSSPDEKKILNLLKEHDKIHIDEIRSQNSVPAGSLPGLLLNMEMKGWIKSLPGNYYKIKMQ